VTTGFGERLASEDPNERVAACRAIPDDPAAALLIEPLAAVLGDREPGVARAAIEALVAIGRSDAEVVPLGRRVLRGDSPRARLPAALLLARLEPPGPELFPALVEGLAHPEGPWRWAAARVLVEIGRLHGETLTLLLGLVATSEDPATQRMAIYALRELAPDRPDAATALLAASRAPELPVRRAALVAMGGLFEPPPEVLARLREVARGDEPGLRKLGEAALRGLGDPVAPANDTPRSP